MGHRLHDLQPARGAKKRRKRVGRGTGSGHGTTATRGTKGQKARSGGGKGPFFEGGKTPLQRKLPTYPGFRNPFRRPYVPVNLERLNVFSDGESVTLEHLREKGIIKASETRIKILGRGDLDVKLAKIQAHAFSEGAKTALEKAGTDIEVIG